MQFYIAFRFAKAMRCIDGRKKAVFLDESGFTITNYEEKKLRDNNRDYETYFSFGCRPLARKLLFARPFFERFLFFGEFERTRFL